MTADEVREFLVEHFELQDDEDDIVGQYINSKMNRLNQCIDIVATFYPQVRNDKFNPFKNYLPEDVANDFEEWADRVVEREPPQDLYVVKRVAGYCALCRAKELELYDDILNRPGKKHDRACREAGCKHPYEYLI